MSPITTVFGMGVTALEAAVLSLAWLFYVPTTWAALCYKRWEL